MIELITIVAIIGLFFFMIWSVIQPPPKKPLTVMFYRTVIIISQNVDHAIATKNFQLLKECRNRIDSNCEFSREDACVVKQMLLNDIKDAHVIIAKFTTQ